MNVDTAVLSKNSQKPQSLIIPNKNNGIMIQISKKHVLIVTVHYSNTQIQRRSCV